MRRSDVLMAAVGEVGRQTGKPGYSVPKLRLILRGKIRKGKKLKKGYHLELSVRTSSEYLGCRLLPMRGCHLHSHETIISCVDRADFHCQ